MPQTLADLRRAVHLTQEEVARRVKVAEGTVRAWEAGRQSPSRRNTQRLAKALEVTVEDLGLGRER